MRAFFGFLFFGLVAVVAGLIGYQAGVTSSAAAAGATVVVTGGLGGLGLLLAFLFLGFAFVAVAGAAARRHRAWAPGHGPWAQRMGPGGPAGRGWPADPSDPRRQWLAEMHRSLHAADEDGSDGTDGAAPDVPAGRGPTGAMPA
jgi:NAD(P)-dependent dehydrogenase (short-subunit alcohol dehydrogenase family)